ncbi:MAG TPA: lysyl oxidase family protein [Acidimicrobiales bacterium]|nr:lysyl oxidase family protein [Acidimicrobiales bacterium]
MVSAVVAVLAAGLGGVAQADDGPVPEPCQLHPVHVVNPGCVPALTSDIDDPGITLPNLVPDVSVVTINRTTSFTLPEFTFGPWQLYFDTRAQNLGTVPLQLTADGIEDAETTTVSQCVSWTAGRLCRDQRPVGLNSFDDGHHHFHFQEFARYELRRLAPDGRPDYSDTGLVAANDKVSFCLIDSQRVRDDASPAPFYTTCTPSTEGISPGWTDIYGAGLPGQTFPTEGLTDGRYALVIDMDYANRLYETDDTDNVVEVTIEISGGVRQAAIVGKHRP